MEVYSEEEESGWVIRTRTLGDQDQDLLSTGKGRVAQEEGVTRVLSILLGATGLWFYRMVELDDPCNVLKSTDLGWPV